MTGQVRARLQASGIALVVLGAPFFFFPEVIPAPVRTLGVGVITVAALALALALSEEDRTARGLLAALVVTGVVAWLMAPTSPVALSHFAGFGLGLLVMSVIASWSRTEGRLMWVSMAFLAAGLVVVTLGLAGTWVRLVGPETRPRVFPVDFNRWVPYIGIDQVLPGIIKGAGVNKNALGVSTLLVVPLALTVAFMARRSALALSVRVLAALTAMAGLFVFLVAESRSVWTAGWVMAVVWCLRVTRGNRRRLALGILVALPVAGGLVLVATDPSRFVAYAERVNLSTESREWIWGQAAARLAGSYGAGIGFNQFRQIIGSDGAPRRIAHAHNIFLQTALDLGLLGLAAYVALMATLLRRADQVARGRSPVAAAVAAGAGLVLVGVHVFGLGDAVSLGARIGIFQWLAAGMILSAWHLHRAAGAGQHS